MLLLNSNKVTMHIIKLFGMPGMILLLLFTAAFSPKSDDIIGKWENPDGGRKIEIFKKGELYFGKIIAVSDEGAKVKPGDVVLKNITYKKGKWNGQLRIPAKDNDFNTEMTMPSINKLKFVASYGFTTRTKIWNRML
jgi:uncharacterized protein (DUF2147 family)